MSLRACLPGLVADGKISPEQADDAAKLFDDLHQDFRRQFGDQAAAAMASDSTLAAMQRQASRKKYLAAQTIGARKRIELNLKTFGGGDPAGPMNPRAAVALLDRDPRARFSNVEMRRKAILGDAQRMIDGILAKHSTNIIGQVRSKAELDQLVRETFGKDTGNASAKEFAAAWLEMAEMLRQRFNAAGGNIGKLDNWGLPQSHDWEKVRAAGFTAWRDFVGPKLDRTKMLDRATGMPMSDARLELVLKDVWDTIRTNGRSDMTPGATMGAGMLANRRGDRRVLIFDGADNWLAYNDSFGRGSPYDAMMGHIEGMARDTAAMEILGPNPAATLKWVQESLAHEASLDTAPGTDAIGQAERAGKQMQELWNEYTGAHNEPRNEKLAMAFSGYRAWNVATKLGGAFLSAPADFAFTQTRAAFNGLSQVRMIGKYLKQMAPGALEDQKLAIRRGLIAEEWGRRTGAGMRTTFEEISGEIPRRFAEGVLRASLLSRHTQALRWVNGMEWLSTFTEHAGQGFDALPPKLRSALERNGIGADGWETLRLAPMETDRGVEWLTPSNSGDRELASRFMEMIHGEANLAVPTPGLRTRAMLNARLERGTVLGETGRSLLLFKSFGITAIADQAREMMAMGGVQAAKYGANLFIGTTLMGAVSVALKDVAAGRDPRDMASLEFLGQAILQGGGLGILGDFLRSAESRTGGGLAGAIAGPIVSDVQELFDIGSKAASGGNWEQAAFKTVKGLLPGNNLWYARLAFDRLIADQIQQFIDPNYSASWRRMEKWAAEQGTEFWWSPGELAPERAPDLANVAGGSAQ